MTSKCEQNELGDYSKGTAKFGGRQRNRGSEEPKYAKIVTASKRYHGQAPYLNLGVAVQAGVPSTGIWEGDISGQYCFVVLGVNPSSKVRTRVCEGIRVRVIR